MSLVQETCESDRTIELLNSKNEILGERVRVLEKEKMESWNCVEMLEKEKHDAQNLIDRASEESLFSGIVYSCCKMMQKLETCNLHDRLNKVEHLEKEKEILSDKDVVEICKLHYIGIKKRDRSCDETFRTLH